MALDIYDSLPMHRAMLADAPRQAAFQAAIAASVRAGDVVLDVGSGTGILAMMAADAGAARVYAVEPSPVAEVAKANALAYGGRITVIRNAIENVVLPEKVDVIVSEWLGAFGIDENLLPMLLVARDRWLKNGGRLLPATVTALVMPVESKGAALAAAAGKWGRELYWAAPGIPSEAALAPPQPMWTTDVARTSIAEAALPMRTRLIFSATRAARLGGFVTWFDADVGSGVPLTNAPGAPETHWGRFVFACPGTPEVAVGDAIEFALTTIPGEPGWCHHAWSIAVGGQVLHCDTRGRRGFVLV